MNWLPHNARMSKRASRRGSSRDVLDDDEGADSQLVARVAALEQRLESGLGAMSATVAESEDRLKMRITQMEVAVIGALKAAGRSAAAPGPRPILNVDGDVPRSVGHHKSREDVGAPPPILADALGEAPGASAPGSSSSLLGPSGEGEGGADAASRLAMQTLVDGDAEIRSQLNYLRRQVAITSSKEQSKEQSQNTPRRGSIGSSADATAFGGRTATSLVPAKGGEVEQQGLCRRLFGPVLHPDEQFRSVRSRAPHGRAPVPRARAARGAPPLTPRAASAVCACRCGMRRWPC